jgi:hypothetical protein
MKHEEAEEILKKTANQIKQIEEIGQYFNDHQKSIDLVNQHLNPCGEDLILLTLKGHLIIENLLDTNLCRLLSVHNLPGKKGRLGFMQKLYLLKEVVIECEEPGPNSDLFCAIDDLNELRNQIAHKLKNQEEIQRDTRNFVKNNRQKLGIKLALDKPLPAQLKACIVKLFNFLIKVMHHFYKLDRKAAA